MVGPIVLFRGPPHGGACCVGAWPPLCWGVMCPCVLPPMVGRAVLARGPPHGRACCVVVGPPSWWGVLCRCVPRLMVGRAVLLPARRGGCAWCGGAGLGLSSVPPGNRARVGGVLAGAMRCLFCWFGVVFAALRSACLVAVVGGRVAVGAVLFAWPGLVLCWCVAPLLVGFAELVHDPPHGRACCVGAHPRTLWNVMCRCVAPPVVGRAVLACDSPHGRLCCIVVRPPSWLGVLCWCVAPLMAGRALLLPVRRGGCAWCCGAWLRMSLCVPPGGRRCCVRVGGACVGVLAGAMRGLFC